MIARLGLWWQKRKQLPLISTGIIAFIALIFLGYWFHWAWTGFNKTLWDWMQLLIIPVALAFIAIWFNRNERKSEQEIATDNQREAALQGYIDKMSELLLEKHLRDSAEEDEVRKIARVRTLTALPRLDKERKTSLLLFLYESGLISKDKSIVDLREADLKGTILLLNNLSGVDLRGAYMVEAFMVGVQLKGADLREVSLYKAHVLEANLTGADLSSSYLRGANLSRTDLSGADLSEADLLAAVINEANLSRATLRSAILCGADLREANLSRASLRQADLREANLSGANLSGANLSGAKVSSEQLDKVSSLKGATMPDGSIHP